MTVNLARLELLAAAKAAADQLVLIALAVRGAVPLPSGAQGSP